MSRLVALCILLAGVSAPSRAADGPKTEVPQIQRAVFVVKHGTAENLAETLAKHFKGQAEISALPGASSNSILVSAPPVLMNEITAILAKLDQPTRAVTLEVMVVEVPPGKEDDKGPAPADFGGPAEDVMKKVAALRRSGRLGEVRQFRLSALEGQPASVRVGASRPYTVGSVVTGTGRSTRSISYRDTGTDIETTARVNPDGTVSLELTLSDSRMHLPEDGVVIGTDADNKPLRAAEFVHSRLKTRLKLAPGRAVAAEDVTTTSKGGRAQTIVIVTARVVGADAKKGD